MKLRLEARVSSDLPDAVGRFLVGKFGATSVARDGNDWFVRAAGHRGLVPVVLRYGVCLAKQGNGQNVMGATLSALSEKEKKKSRKRKKKSRKRKVPFENKKTPLKRLLPAGDPALTA